MHWVAQVIGNSRFNKNSPLLVVLDLKITRSCQQGGGDLVWRPMCVHVVITLALITTRFIIMLVWELV